MAFKTFSINGHEVKTLSINGKQVKLGAAPQYTGLKLTAVQDGSSVALNKADGNPTTMNLEFSMDGSNWQTFNTGTTYALANVGDYLLLRAPEGHPNPDGTAQPYKKHRFTMVGGIKASGNIMSLYDYDGERRTLTQEGFNSLFQDCTALVDVSELELPATTLTRYCYTSLFRNTSITSAPSILPATELAEYSYENMFKDCKSLQTPPVISATTMPHYSCQYMFQGCTSLTSTPELLPTFVGSFTYRSMFENCTSLTAASEIHLKNFQTGGGNYMFNGCSQLNYVKTALPASLLSSGSNHSSWLNAVASTGTYESTDPDFDESLITTRNGNTIPSGWSITKPTVFKLTSKQAGSTVALNRNGNPATLHLEMSRNGKTWTPFVVDYTYDIGGNNDYILLRAPASQPNTNGTAQSSTNYHQFAMTGNVEAGGNIMALYSSEGTSAMTHSGFYKLFNGCSALKKAPKLEATLAGNCYAYMLVGTGITAAPELAQTTLATGCYQHMFEGCASLTAAPELPAATLANSCYKSMFKDCTNITKAPTLIAETAEIGCYSNMFNGCSRLNEVRAAIADDYLTTDYTENWLAGVASTGNFYTDDNDFTVERGPTTMPVGWTINALGDGEGAFRLSTTVSNGYVKLETTGNPKPANLYYSKDSGQTWHKLPTNTDVSIGYSETMRIVASNVQPNTEGLGQDANNYHTFKLTGQANFIASGNAMTLYDCKGTTRTMTPYGFCGLLSGQSVLTSIKDIQLPATRMADWCYARMFNFNSNIYAAPYLPATQLADSCYREMFNGCSNLNKARTAMTVQQLQSKSYTFSWLASTSATGTYSSSREDFDINQLSQRNGNTIPEGWNVFVNKPLTFTAEEANSTIKLEKVGNPTALHLQYSTNGVVWNPFNVDETYTLANVGDRIIIRAPEGQPNDVGMATGIYHYHKFAVTGKIAASGNVTSLCDYDSSTVMVPHSDGFCRLFYNCTGLTHAPELPCYSLATDCYREMFRGCTNLAVAPKLPAKTLQNSCYKSMFQDCTSLVEVPKLEWSSYHTDCCVSMFNGCSSLSSLICNIPSDQMTAGHTNNWLANAAATGTFYYTDPDFDTEITRSATTVPEGWSIVKYEPPMALKVDSSHKDYFNTGYSLTPTTSISARVKLVEANGTKFFGDTTDDNNDWRLFNFGAAWYWDCGSSRLSISNKSQLSGVWADLSCWNNGVAVNGTTLTDGTAQSNPGGGNNFWLFENNSSTGRDATVYEFSIFDNDVLQHHYVAKENEQGKATFYDTVTETYLTPGIGNAQLVEYDG